MKTEIPNRIVELSSQFPTDKEFLKKCQISNHSLITELKKGRLKSPGSEIIAKIVRGTGCSGTWLLTGEGEMYDPRPNQVAGGDPNVRYAFSLLEKIEQKANGIKDAELPPDVDVQLCRLLLKVLERRSDNP